MTTTSPVLTSLALYVSLIPPWPRDPSTSKRPSITWPMSYGTQLPRASSRSWPHHRLAEILPHIRVSAGPTALSRAAHSLHDVRKPVAAPNGRLRIRADVEHLDHLQADVILRPILDRALE